MRRTLICVSVHSKTEADAEAIRFAETAPIEPDFSVALCSLAGGPITHYAACPEAGPELKAALPGLMLRFPGSNYRTWEEWSIEDGIAWLAEIGLKTWEQS